MTATNAHWINCLRRTWVLFDIDNLLNALMGACRHDEQSYNFLSWKWIMHNTLCALNRRSEASQSLIISSFVLCSPIRKVQSPIYMQNYPTLWKAVCRVPCCVSQCAQRLNHLHKHTQTGAASNICCCRERSSLRYEAVKHTDTPFTVTGFHSNMEPCQDSNCIIGRAQGTIVLLHQ